MSNLGSGDADDFPLEENYRKKLQKLCMWVRNLSGGQLTLEEAADVIQIAGVKFVECQQKRREQNEKQIEPEKKLGEIAYPQAYFSRIVKDKQKSFSDKKRRRETLDLVYEKRRKNAAADYHYTAWLVSEVIEVAERNLSRKEVNFLTLVYVKQTHTEEDFMETWGCNSNAMSQFKSRMFRRLKEIVQKEKKLHRSAS
jgi:hypothetical protein